MVCRRESRRVVEAASLPLRSLGKRLEAASTTEPEIRAVLRCIVSPTNDPARHAAGGGTDSNIQWLLRSAPKGGGGPPPPRRFAHSDRACPKARQRLGMRQSSAVLDDAKNPHQTFSLSPNSEAFSENNTQLGAGSGVFVAAPLSRGGDVDLSLLPLVCARRATPAATERRSHSKPQLRSSS